jgi:hypothetical protein
MEHKIVDTKMPIRSIIWSDESYLGLDAGIRFGVRVLHAHGIETCQSCQGGEGHCYDRPTIDMVAGADDSEGFRALACLQTLEARADDKPMFTYGYWCSI